MRSPEVRLLRQTAGSPEVPCDRANWFAHPSLVKRQSGKISGRPLYFKTSRTSGPGQFE
jgi:hypothetical protein